MQLKSKQSGKGENGRSSKRPQRPSKSDYNLGEWDQEGGREGRAFLCLPVNFGIILSVKPSFFFLSLCLRCVSFVFH